MGSVILVTGGARSGKSTFAEEFVNGLGSNVMYIATAIPFDHEMKERIKKHKEVRPKTWYTHEGYKNIDKVIDENGQSYPIILLDCVTVMITNIMFDYPGFYENNIDLSLLDKVEEHIQAEFNRIINTVKSKNITTVMVTNELGSGIVPESKLGRIFRDIAGRINQMIAKEADEVYFLVSGISMKIK